MMRAGQRHARKHLTRKIDKGEDNTGVCCLSSQWLPEALHHEGCREPFIIRKVTDTNIITIPTAIRRVSVSSRTRSPRQTAVSGTRAPKMAVVVLPIS